MKIKFLIFVIISLNTLIFHANSNEKYNYFQILLNKKNYLILNSLILENYKNKIILPEFEKKLSGDILYKDEKIPIKLWLGGIGQEHYDRNQINNNTLEIRVKKNKYFLNTKKFRILSPKAFRYDFPLTYNEILNYLEIPNQYIIPIKFLITSNNNSAFKEMQNIFLIVEKFDSDYLDRNFLRQSTIFERDLHQGKENKKIIYKLRNGLINKKKYDSLVDELNFVNKDKLKIINNIKNENVDKYATKLFLKYLNNQQSALDTFDLNQLSKVFALHTIINNYHALSDHNLKFYFNRFTKKLEILPSDPHSPILIDESKRKNEFIKNLKNHYDFFPGTWYENLIEDDNFKYQYINSLKNLVNDEKFINKLDNLPYFFSKQKTSENVEIIKKNIKFFQNYFSNNKLVLNKNLEIYNSEYFRYDHSDKKIYLNSNNISKPLVVGEEFKDYELIFDKEEINFIKSGSIIINSNFSCNNKLKTTISSKSKFNYIYFFGKITKIENCDFKNFNYSSSIENQFTTSPITFYKTNLSIKNSTFENSESEDLVNIVDSKVIIENLNLKNSFSDALDIDNSEGKIFRLNIQNCKNDCLDFSSSKFEISQLFIQNSADKGISVGEQSNIDLKNSIIQNCNLLCLAVKDSSIVTLDNVEFKKGKIAIALYVKKKIFNKPILKKKDLKFENIIFEYKAEENLKKILN
jgi:hypothetical protein